MATGTIEVFTEKMYDGTAKLFGKGMADDVVEKVIQKLTKSNAGMTLMRAIAGAAGEGTEEVVSDLLNPFAQMIYNDTSLKETFASLPEKRADMLYDYLIGFALGGLGSGGSIITGQDAAKNRARWTREVESEELYNDQQAALENIRGQTLSNGYGLQDDMSGAIRGIYKQAGVELSDTEASLLADGYTPAGGDAQEYIFGTLDAYRLGGIGLTLEQAQKNSKYTEQLHPKQFEHAWQLGSAQKNTAPESGTVNSNIGYSPERAAEIRHEGKNFKNLVAGIDTSIKDFFTKWKNGRKQHQGDKFEKLYLGAISDDARQKISSILGYEVTSTDYILSNDGVKHILDQHGDPQKEIANGNLPITDNVLESLPEVLANPDSIEPGGKDRFGDRDGVVFKKALADGNVVYIQFDNSGRKTIEGKTLYVKPVTTSVTNAGTPTPVSTPKAPEPVTQQESAAPAPNISQSGEDVNTEAGRGRLVSALAALGSHATESADAFEAGQDISSYAAAMNKAASLYAAHGADLKTIVQQARDGETADIVGVLTDAQVETAIQIGQQMQAKSREKVQQLDAQFKSIRERAAALQSESINSSIEAARKELAEVQRQFSEKLDAAEGEEAENAYTELEALAERMNKLDSEIKALENEARSKTAQRKKGTVSFEGAVIDGVKYKGVDRRKLNRQQKNIVAMVERLADLVNIDYVLLDGKRGMGGYYQGGKIYININFGMAEGLNKHIAAASLSHELTHFMQDYAPAEYEELKSYVVSAILKKSAAEFDALVQQQAQWEPGKSYEELVDELVANACQTMLLDDRAVAKLARQNMSLAEKIADVLEDIYVKIKAAFKEIDFSADTTLFRPVQAVMDEMDAIAERWSDGIAAATENYNALQTVGQNTAPNRQNTDRGQYQNFLDSYTEREKENWKDSKRLVVYENDAQLTAFVNRALSEPQFKQRMLFGKIGKALAAKIKGSTGYDLAGRNITLRADNVRKLVKSHGNSHDEELRGQRAVTPVDYTYLAEIVSDADSMERGDYQGKPAVTFSKQYGNLRRTAFMVDSGKGSLDLFLQTMYINEKRSIAHMPNAESSRQTPETTVGTASEISISEVLQNGKGKFQMFENVEATDKLVAVHNKSVRGLRRMLQRGGVPFPSIAIKKAGSSHEGFGEVSIVFPRSTIDPEVNKQNRLYSNDAWTPTEPIEEFDVGNMRRYTDKLRKELGRTFDDLRGSAYLHEDEIARKLRSSKGDIYEALNEIDVLRYAYMKSLGIEPKTDKAGDDFYELSRQLRMDERLNKSSGYRRWIERNFGDLIVDRGIPNGKELYTNSGNRRSFKQTHVAATLENITQQMRKQAETGVGFFGMNLRGVASKTYDNVEQMRADSGRLVGTHLTDEAFDEPLKELDNRLHELGQEAAKASSWSSRDAAEEIMLEAVRDAKSKAQMDRMLRKEAQFINYSPELTEKLWTLSNDARNMPAPFFEAKPRRIVYPDEALAYIIPDDAASDVQQALDERGYNVLTYKAGDEQDRLAKLNSVEGGRFQRWDNTSDDTAEESRGRELAYTRLQSENAILNETVAELRKLTDRQNNTIGKLQDKLRLTKTPEARQSDAKRLARAYLSEYSSRADMESIAGQLKTVGIKKAATIPFSGVVAADFFELVRQMAFFEALHRKAKSPQSLGITGFFGGCGGRIRTNDLRVMSCVRRLRRALLAAFNAFVSMFFGVVDPFILPAHLRIFPRMGQSVGQKGIVQSMVHTSAEFALLYKE